MSDRPNIFEGNCCPCCGKPKCQTKSEIVRNRLKEKLEARRNKIEPCLDVTCKKECTTDCNKCHDNELMDLNCLVNWIEGEDSIKKKCGVRNQVAQKKAKHNHTELCLHSGPARNIKHHTEECLPRFNSTTQNKKHHHTEECLPRFDSTTQEERKHHHHHTVDSDETVDREIEVFVQMLGSINQNKPVCLLLSAEQKEMIMEMIGKWLSLNLEMVHDH